MDSEEYWSHPVFSCTFVSSHQLLLMTDIYNIFAFVTTSTLDAK